MAAKVAISIEPDLLARMESLRRSTKESRSAVFSRAARVLLGADARRQRIQRYLEAYREAPERESDLAWAEDVARATLARVEWAE